MIFSTTYNNKRRRREEAKQQIRTIIITRIIIILLFVSSIHNDERATRSNDKKYSSYIYLLRSKTKSQFANDNNNVTEFNLIYLKHFYSICE